MITWPCTKLVGAHFLPHFIAALHQNLSGCFTSQPSPSVYVQMMNPNDVLSSPAEQRWAETPYINLPRSVWALNPDSTPQCALHSRDCRCKFMLSLNEHDFFLVGNRGVGDYLLTDRAVTLRPHSIIRLWDNSVKFQLCYWDVFRSLVQYTCQPASLRSSYHGCLSLFLFLNAAFWLADDCCPTVNM